MDFPAIKGPADPEDFSWQVALGQGQELKQTDGQKVEVLFEEGHHAFTIAAEQARDATGVEVPTSLTLSGPDVLTLTVHHRAGNPAAAGTPFQYPISAGPPYEVGYSTVIVTGPLDEEQLRQQREGAGREEATATDAAAEAPRSCLVPALRGISLRAAKRQLRQASCGIGGVSKRAGATARGGRVTGQHPRAGATLAVGAEVDLTLVPRRG